MNGLFKKDFSSLNRRRKPKPATVGSGSFKVLNNLEESTTDLGVKQSNLHDKPKTSQFLQKLEAFRAHKSGQKSESISSKEVKRVKQDQDVSKGEIKTPKKLFEIGPKLLKEEPAAFLMLKSLETNGKRLVGDVNKPLMLNILPHDEYVYFTVGDRIIEKIILKRKQHISKILLSDVGRSLLIIVGVDRGYVYVNYLSLDADLMERFEDKPDLWPVDVTKRFKNVELLKQVDHIKKMIEAAKRDRESGSGTSITLPEAAKPIQIDGFSIDNTPRRNPTLIGSSRTAPSKNLHTLAPNTPVKSERVTRQSFLSSPSRPPSELISLDMHARTRSRVPKSPVEDTQLEKPEPFDPPLSYKFGDGKLFVVTYSDFKTLYNNDWINDTVIDFFIKYDIEEAILEERFKENDIYAFNSFFFPKLMSGDQTSTEPVNYYQNVTRWLQKVDLMNFPYVLIPINEHSHWYCCIIKGLPNALEYFKLHPREVEADPDYYGEGDKKREKEGDRKKATSAMSKRLDLLQVKETSSKLEKLKETELQYSKSNTSDKSDHVNSDEPNGSDKSDLTKKNQEFSEGEESESDVKQESANTSYLHTNSEKEKSSGPKVEIFIFDSLSLNHSSIKNPLKEFIIDYCNDKHQVSIPKENIRMVNAKVPKQNNFNDCGIHVIFNVRKWLSDSNECERLWRSGRSSAANFQSRQFFKASERNTMRKLLRDTLLLMQKSPRNITFKLTSTSEVDDDDIEIIEMNEDKSRTVQEDPSAAMNKSANNRFPTQKLIEDRDSPFGNQKALTGVIHNRSLRTGLIRKKFSNLTVRILNLIFEGDEIILQQFISQISDFASKIDGIDPENSRYIAEVDKFLAMVDEHRSMVANGKNKSLREGKVRPKDEKLVIQDEEKEEEKEEDEKEEEEVVGKEGGLGIASKQQKEDEELNESVGSLGISGEVLAATLSPRHRYRSFPNKRRRLGKQ